MTATKPKPLTVAEYLTLEKASEIRHEFVDGLMLAMAGETRRHKRIVLNLIRALERQALERDCELVFDTTKIRTRSTRFRYPDVVVSCAPGDDEYFLENPCLLVEVLPQSIEKLDEYLKLEGLQRYVLVDQTTKRVIVYARAPQGWMVEVPDSEGQFEVPCLETSVTLEQVYAGVNFGPLAEPIPESANLEPGESANLEPGESASLERA